MQAQFCLTCGSQLLDFEDEGRTRRRCSNIGCARVHYDQLIVGAGALIEANGKVLLVLRKRPPFAGKWGLPAGHVEADENPRYAAERETKEETGLVVQAITLFDVFFFEDHPKGKGIFLVYECSVVSGDAVETEEAGCSRYFRPSELPEIAGGGHSIAVEAWRNRGVANRA